MVSNTYDDDSNIRHDSFNMVDMYLNLKSLAWIGIEKDFSTSVYIFIGGYLLLVIVTAIAWYDGISKREDLIKLLIQEKLREEAIEEEKKFNPIKVWILFDLNILIFVKKFYLLRNYVYYIYQY